MYYINTGKKDKGQLLKGRILVHTVFQEVVSKNHFVKYRHVVLSSFFLISFFSFLFVLPSDVLYICVCSVLWPFASMSEDVCRSMTLCHISHFN
jgi:hypothetical protein